MGSYFEQDRGSWRYDFSLYRVRYRAPRGFRTKKLCDDAERALRDQLMADHAGVPRRVSNAPTFTRWASTTYDYAVKRRKLRDPATFDRNLRKILLFWGDKPSDPTKVVDGAPYHGLRLDAPIRDGGWLLKFEEWMDTQEIAGSTKNHYRSACSRLYAIAMAPEYRQQTGIVLNPFRGIPRDRTRRRTEAFTRGQLAQLFTVAPPFLQTAMRIALYAPALRLSNIVNLQWSSIDGAWIRIQDHKTEGHTERPLVSPIVPALAAHLAALPQNGPYVIQEDGDPIPVRRLQRAFRAAVKAIGLPYGASIGEYSFHTLRHTAATLMAEIGIPDAQRQEAIGHLALQTTQGYTHLTPTHKIGPLVQLAETLSDVIPEAKPRLALVSQATRRK